MQYISVDKRYTPLLVKTFFTRNFHNDQVRSPLLFRNFRMPPFFLVSMAWKVSQNRNIHPSFHRT